MASQADVQFHYDIDMIFFKLFSIKIIAFIVVGFGENA